MKLTLGAKNITLGLERRNLVTLAICLALAAIMGGGLLWPTFGEVERLEAKLVTQDERLQAGRQIVALKEALRQHLQQLQEVELPTAPELPAVAAHPLEAVQRLSDRHGASLVELNTTGPSRAADADTINLQAAFLGQPEPLHKLTMGLLLLPSLRQLREVGVSRQGEDFILRVKLQVATGDDS
ncbi:MAG: hypothetical protein U5J62_08950 [Desulfurivibrio sp.]|nr:hypothetical protein [Desulfurivibrio sp.]